MCDNLRNILIYFGIEEYDDILSIFYSFDLIRFERMPPPLPIMSSWIFFFSSLLLIKIESMVVNGILNTLNFNTI